MEPVNPEVFPDLDTPDGFKIRLTRFNGGDKGPVLVVHGVSVCTGMFTLSTVKENFASFLMKHGYDVWLLDWRASIRMPLRAFTLDEVAENDYPTAVRFICEQTRKDSVQAIVHCIGSVSFFMSLASGRLPQVRCVACSQVALHPITGLVMKLKARMRLGSALAWTGMTHVSPLPDPDYPWFALLLRMMVNLVHHECRDTSCHRMTFMYGHLYPHFSLNVATHEAIDEQFGPCNMRTLAHLQQITNLGQLAKFDYGTAENLKRYGSAKSPSYLEKPENLKVPITLISGALNKCFIPDSTRKSFDWLCQMNDPKLYTRRVIPNFGHFDNFVGAQANQYCYPAYLEQLQRCP